MSPQLSKHYVAFLIRLWREEPGVWRGMLENPQTGERHHFQNVNQLLAFLRNQVKECDEAAPEQELPL